mgnify:CR=1
MKVPSRWIPPAREYFFLFAGLHVKTMKDPGMLFFLVSYIFIEIFVQGRYYRQNTI